ncbi:uncharacterized protein TNCV_4076141 [Trichonephila clavipes]|nr:uncharacterized protein TNCV_4076141 [Trichonephila clavipes]
MQAVETKIRESRRFTLTTHSLEFPDVSRLMVYKIVTKDLNFNKLCSRRAPRLLTAEHIEKRFASALDFLIRYEEEGDDMLSRILTGDEIWVCHINPKSKQHSRWNGDTHPLTSRSKPKKRCQSGRLWQQCYGISVVFC